MFELELVSVAELESKLETTGLDAGPWSTCWQSSIHQFDLVVVLQLVVASGCQTIIRFHSHYHGAAKRSSQQA